LAQEFIATQFTRLSKKHMQLQATFNLGFIGGGNMASAIMIGLQHQHFDTKRIQVVELDADKRAQLQQTFGVLTTDQLSEVAKQDVIVLAVKPQQLKTVAQSLAPLLKHQLIISVAAGIRLEDISRWLGNHLSVVRAMPNTPAQIQAGITGVYAMPHVSELQKQQTNQLLDAIGETVWLDREEDLDAVTAISGSGPAYVFYLIEALQEAALALGLSEDQAKLLSIATFQGASQLAATSNTPVQTLRAQVTSKGGTTEQGILSLETSQVKQAILRAAQQAEKRAKIMADELGKQ
jgi:pyrroline-5-carboxylate reductase